MKKIEAIIKPQRFDEVKEALKEIGATGITVCVIQMPHPTKVYIQHNRMETVVDLQTMKKVECFVEDGQLELAGRAIHRAAKTGARGDGYITYVNVGGQINIDDEVRQAALS